MKTAFLLFLLLFPPMAALADQVTWMAGDTPPLYIVRGEDAGQGFSDRQLDFLIKHLPGFTHTIVRSNAKRTLFEMEHRDGVCSITLLRDSEREKVMEFSARPIVIPAFRLVALDSRRDAITPLLTTDGEIDLDALAASGTLNGAYVQSRLYPAPITQFLNIPAVKSRLEDLPDTSPMFNLLRTGRVDFVFLNGLEARYYAGKADILSLPIKGVPRTMAMYPGCSERLLGRRVVARIDQLLADETNWAAFLAPLRDWMGEVDFAAALAVQPVKTGRH